MTTHDPIDELSKRFLDLWQKQLAASFKDPALISTMLQTMQQMQAFTEQQSHAQSSDSSSAGLSEPRSDTLHELIDRLTACEERLAILESQLEQRGNSPPPPAEDAS